MQQLTGQIRVEERLLNQALVHMNSRVKTPNSKIGQSHSENEHDKTAASFNHGYYVARDIQRQKDPGTNLPEPQEQYYKMLIKRYMAMRTFLARVASNAEKIMDQMDSKPANSLVPPKNRSEWKYALSRQNPTPMQVSQLDDRSLSRGLYYCAQEIERHHTITKRQSYWIWALLAKAGEVDTMDSERVAPIRDLARIAGQLRNQTRQPEIHSEESGDESEEIDDWGVDNLEMDCVGSDYDSDNGSTPLGQKYVLAENDIEESSQIDMLPKKVIRPTEDATHAPEVLHKIESEKVVEDNTDSGADMSMSEEGEVQDDTEPTTLEEARARLLAQLGDRLVQPQTNSESQETKAKKNSDLRHHNANGIIPSSSSSTPPRTARHRHNGKVCHDPSCAKVRQQRSHQNAGVGFKQDKGPSRQKPEFLRSQNIRSECEVLSEGEVESSNNQATSEVSCTTTNFEEQHIGESASTDTYPQLPKKIFSSRAEAEEYRQQQFGVEPMTQENVPNQARSDLQMTEVDIPDLNTRVTIDMVLTVAAECYGQKDLLKYRDNWSY